MGFGLLCICPLKAPYEQVKSNGQQVNTLLKVNHPNTPLFWSLSLSSFFVSFDWDFFLHKEKSKDLLLLFVDLP